MLLKEEHVCAKRVWFVKSSINILYLDKQVYSLNSFWQENMEVLIHFIYVLQSQNAVMGQRLSFERQFCQYSHLHSTLYIPRPYIYNFL